MKYTDEQKELIIRTYLERGSGSLRGMRRLFGVAPATLTSWIKKASIPIKTTLLPARMDDVLELNDCLSVVQNQI
ncbi:MAG: transposase [Pseudomonadota bacterium]|nr:transposase [Pseudomonadota bacterium]